jgi:hypothetical protein
MSNRFFSPPPLKQRKQMLMTGLRKKRCAFQSLNRNPRRSA